MVLDFSRFTPENPGTWVLNLHKSVHAWPGREGTFPDQNRERFEMILKKSVLFPLFLRTGGAFLVIASVVAATHLIERSVALTQDPPAEEEFEEEEVEDY